jgi:hypothetical protein
MFISAFFMNAIFWTGIANKNAATMAAARRVTDNAMTSVLPDDVAEDINNGALDIEVVNTDAINATIRWNNNAGTTSLSNLTKSEITVSRNSNDATAVSGGMVRDAGKEITYKVFTISP